MWPPIAIFPKGPLKFWPIKFWTRPRENLTLESLRVSDKIWLEHLCSAQFLCWFGVLWTVQKRPIGYGTFLNSPCPVSSDLNFFQSILTISTNFKISSTTSNTCWLISFIHLAIHAWILFRNSTKYPAASKISRKIWSIFGMKNSAI